MTSRDGSLIRFFFFFFIRVRYGGDNKKTMRQVVVCREV